MVSILVSQCRNKERFNRLTAITWVHEFIALGRDQLLLFYSEVSVISHPSKFQCGSRLKVCQGGAEDGARGTAGVPHPC